MYMFTQNKKKTLAYIMHFATITTQVFTVWEKLHRSSV